MLQWNQIPSFHHCFLFFLKFSLSLLGCLPCWGLWVFGIWLFQLGFAVWNVVITTKNKKKIIVITIIIIIITIIIIIIIIIIITTTIKGAFSRKQVYPTGSMDHKAGSAVYGWLPNCDEDFLIPMYISGKVFMKMWSVVIKILGVILPLNVGGGLCFTDNFQNLMDCSLYHSRHFQKILSKSVHNFLSKVVDRQTTNKRH